MDIGKDLQEAYEQGRRDALNEIMEYTYGMLTAEKFGLQHKIKSMMSTTDTPQTDAEIPKNALRSDCTGCRFVGTYDTEFPCANCVRKNKDYYDSKYTERSDDE